MWGPFYFSPALPYHLLRILTQTWMRVLGEPLKAELKLRQALRNQIARMTNGCRRWVSSAPRAIGTTFPHCKEGEVWSARVSAFTPWGRPATGSLGSAAPRRYPSATAPPRLVAPRAPATTAAPADPAVPRSYRPSSRHPALPTLRCQPRVPARLPPGAGRPRSLARILECCSGTRSRTGAPDRPATQSTGAERGRGGRGRARRRPRSGPGGTPRRANPGGEPGGPGRPRPPRRLPA